MRAGQAFVCKNGSLFISRHKAVCELCKKEKTVSVFLPGRKLKHNRLALQLNTCSQCKKMVCDCCYVITSDKASIDGLCVECARKLGIQGMTTAEVLKTSE